MTKEIASMNSRVGGVRIPYEKITLELPPKVKIHELITLHRDGSVRYFAQFTLATEPFKDPDVVGIIYNDVQGPTLPEVVISDVFKFDGTFLKCIFSLRLLLSRYVRISYYHISIYRSSDATIQPLGIQKFPVAAELRLRAAL